MTLERIAPHGVHEARGYTHVIKTSGRSTVYVSGQVGVKPDGSVAEGLEAQARTAFANLRAALGAAGAKPENVAKITTYVVDYSPEKRAAIAGVRGEMWGDQPPASTLIGVQALATPQLLIEIEAIAVVD
jgi:enamine deaminase RidA (YjgF/YER057c/UK114 family)